METNDKINRKILVPQNEHFYRNVMERVMSLSKDFVSIKFDDINNVINVCNEKGINIIFPNSCEQITFLLDNYDLLKEKNIKFCIPDRNIFECFNDKSKFYEYMANNGFSSYVPKIYNKITYPCILKHKSKCYGHSTHIIKNKKDIPNDINYNDYVISEIIEGDVEYASHLFALNGSIIMDLTIKHNFDKSVFVYGITKRPLSSIEVKTNGNVYNIFKDIIRKSNFNGILCVDYKIVNGIPIIFEINPRMGASLIRTGNLLKFIDKYIQVCS